MNRPDWFDGLTRRRPSVKWILYYAPRNPPGPEPARLEQCGGVHGVRRAELSEWYWKTLDRAYIFLVQQGRPNLPANGPALRIYLCSVTDVSRGRCDAVTTQFPLQKVSGHTTPRVGTMIMLPASNGEPVWEAELAQALTAAVHELSHALNMQVLPLLRFDRALDDARKQLLDDWEWFDEGMAVAAEAAFAAEQIRLRQRGDSNALPLCNDWLCFALDWADRPDRALHDPNAVYQAGFFVCYLERRMGGPQFVRDVWAESARVWEPVPPKDCTPLRALEKVCRLKGVDFCSATNLDVFASGYCFDSYFLNDSKSDAYEPEVFERFRERAVTRSWRMAEPAEWPDGTQEKYSLPGLACRYFRFMPPPKEKTATLKVRVTGASIQNLKAELALAFGQPESGHRMSHQQCQAKRVLLQANGSGELVGEIQNYPESECHHAVLVVTNCDTISGPALRVEFSVSATLS